MIYAARRLRHTPSRPRGALYVIERLLAARRPSLGSREREPETPGSGARLGPGREAREFRVRRRQSMKVYFHHNRGFAASIRFETHGAVAQRTSQIIGSARVRSAKTRGTGVGGRGGSRPNDRHLARGPPQPSRVIGSMLAAAAFVASRPGPGPVPDARCALRVGLAFDRPDPRLFGDYSHSRDPPKGRLEGRRAGRTEASRRTSYNTRDFASLNLEGLGHGPLGALRPSIGDRP